MRKADRGRKGGGRREREREGGGDEKTGDKETVTEKGTQGVRWETGRQTGKKQKQGGGGGGSE